VHAPRADRHRQTRVVGLVSGPAPSRKRRRRGWCSSITIDSSAALVGLRCRKLSRHSSGTCSAAVACTQVWLGRGAEAAGLCEFPGYSGEWMNCGNSNGKGEFNSEMSELAYSGIRPWQGDLS
jgi:hypothetical protein